jgi:hypothetical protein
MFNFAHISARKRPPSTKRGGPAVVDLVWLILHESGTFVRFTETGAALFA